MIAIAGARVVTIGAFPVRLQANGGLPLYNDFLNVLENCFAFSQSQAERCWLQILALHGSDFASLLLAIVADHDYLQFEDHGCTLRSCQNAWIWLFASRRSNRSGRNS